jgi:FkbM family methyltransferase
VGYISACFLKNIRDAKVIAVEPQPMILDLLRCNLEQFGLDRYRIVPIALSDRDGEGWFEVCDWNTGAGRLVVQKSELTTRVEVWSADRFFSNLAINKLDLIKIDVEGHEDTIFRVCRPALDRLHPKVILFEDQARKSAPNGSIGTLMREIGYHVFAIRKRLTKIELYQSSD